MSERVILMYGYWHGFMWLWMLLPILLVVLVIYLLVKPSNSKYESDKGKNREKDAIDILDERYAKGEISEEEYKIKKDNLTKQ